MKSSKPSTPLTVVMSCTYAATNAKGSPELRNNVSSPSRPRYDIRSYTLHAPEDYHSSR